MPPYFIYPILFNTTVLKCTPIVLFLLIDKVLYVK